MIKKNKIKELRKKTRGNSYTIFICSFFFVLFSPNFFSQDSIPAAKDLTEEKELDFQHFFFKALSEKSIGNYQKAIENLESCNQVLVNDIAVFFEFSKNYLLLNNTLLAKEYIKRALKQDPNNIWMLKHLVKIHIRDKGISEAISTQEKVVAINLKEREFLLKLYIQNRDYKKAVSLMDSMEMDNALPFNFKKLKNNLENRNAQGGVEEKIRNVASLKDQFKSNKSYTILRQILENSKNNTEVLLKYITHGIELFPAQSYLHLLKGKTLNNQKKYKEALLSLQNGIDFVIEDTMEADFYKEMAVSYKGLGNFKEEKKYIKKSTKIKS